MVEWMDGPVRCVVYVFQLEGHRQQPTGQAQVMVEWMGGIRCVVYVFQLKGH